MATAGAHTLKFVGRNSYGGDNTAFIDNVRISASANSQFNPRPTETNIYDAAGNRRRTMVDYYTFTLPSGAVCSLPSDVKEYAGNAVTVVRRGHTDYNLETDYLSRRLLGIVSGKYLYDGNGALASKTIYLYDQWWGGMEATPQQPVQQDGTNYPASLFQGRGNLIWVGRFDVTDPENWNKITNPRIFYNQTGQLTRAQDASGHQTTFVYNDNWSGGSNPNNTFAYPTEVKDAENKSTYTQYNYDFGAPTRVTTPSPNAGQAARPALLGSRTR